MWLVLPLAGCNAILGQSSPRATLSMCSCVEWVPQGAHVDVPFTVNRTSSGPLTLHATLPADITASDVTLADDASSGTITLSASSTSTLGATGAATFQLLEGTQLDDQATLTVGVSGTPGTLDTTWGSGGVVTLPSLGYPTASYVIDIDSRGRIVVGSTVVESDAVVDLVVARYLPDGTLDTTFGDHPAGTRLGYTECYPGTSTNNLVSTQPVGLRIDSQDRIVMANERSAQLCEAEVRRWTVDGALDVTFKTYSNQVNGTQYCGAATGLALEPSGQIVLLAAWNFLTGVETLLQMLDGNDGTPESTYHVTLDASGTSTSNQRFTQMYDLAIDDRGGFVLGGRQYSGSAWMAGSAPIAGAIARVGPDGLRDTAFGTSAAYTPYDPSFATIFWHVAIDPTSKDVFGVGEDAPGTHSSLVRLDGTTGQPSGFGQTTVDACPGGTSQALTQVMVDSRSRVVATGPCAKGGIANIGLVRASVDGVVDATYGSASGITTEGDPHGAKLDADDRLYVVGEIDSTAAVWRFWP
jgi:uncharacterized delta-60 repeat protein